MFSKLDPLLEKAAFTGINDHNDFPPLKNIADKIGQGCKVSHLLLVTGLITTTLLLLNLASFFLSSAIGFIYPAYMSVKAIETEALNDDKQWLTYWLVYSLFQFTTNIFGFITRMIPFFFIFQVAFYVYLFHPKTQGATVIFEKVIDPFILKNQDKINQAIKKGKELAEEQYKNIEKKTE